MTKQEIEEFVAVELSDFNLSTKEKEKIVKFIKNQDEHYTAHKKHYTNAHNIFLEKWEDCIEIFRLQGFDEKMSIELTKNAVIEHNRKEFREKLAFLRFVNLTESVILRDSLSLRFSLEKAHAKKMYLKTINKPELQTIHRIIHESDSSFEKRFNLPMKDILKKFPLTQETIDIWLIISNMTDEKFKNYFKITREELSYLYPTTKDELATIHFISTLSDEETIERYGITRHDLLKKHPLNNDTLKAIRAINTTKQKTVERLFQQPKEEVLKLRTITTEMIKLANKGKLQLQNQNQNTENSKQKKKGTYPQG